MIAESELLDHVFSYWQKEFYHFFTIESVQNSIVKINN